MSSIALYVVGFGRPDLLREQHRLLSQNLLDEHTLIVLDNTIDLRGARNMELTAEQIGISYVAVASERHEHPDALAVAAQLGAEQDYWGCLDHDVFPSAPTTLIDKIDKAGFYGMGQTYTPRVGIEVLRYLWPGWCFFSRAWLAGRVPDFGGIRGERKWDDGDCGSLMHSLFSDADWERMHMGSHEYGAIREEDGYGLQSFGFEQFDGCWIHLTNAAHWKAVPAPEERDELLREMLAAL